MRTISKIYFGVLISLCWTATILSQWQLDRDSNIEYEYVSVVDSSNVFVVGMESQRYIGRRLISGLWDSVNTNGILSDKYLVCITAKDINNVWVGEGIGASSGANIYRTLNGGQNWEVQINSGGSIDFINGINFSRLNTSYGYAWSSPPDNNGDPIKIYKTSNSGNTWNEYIYVPEPDFSGYRPSICVTDSNHAWFNLNKSNGSFDTVRILYTTNGGNNFLLSKLPVLGYWAGSLAFKNDNLYGLSTVYFQTNFLFRTTNSGNSWQILNTQYPLGNTIKLIWIPNSHTWYAATDIEDTVVGKSFYKSTNDGLSWFPMTYPYFPFSKIKYMDGVSYGNKVYLYAVSISGKIFRLFETITTLGINNITGKIPQTISLKQNYPNPFNPSTKITFEITSTDFVELKVYDITGKLISILANEELNAGSYSVEFDGNSLSSGVYFYKLEAGNFIDTKRMILLK